MQSSDLSQRAFSEKNIRLFVWFRVLFNCRFYYPVLAVFFVDLGLSLSQYVLLNAIWAITIVLLEVPSGALADLIGRKRLVVGSAVIMVIEMMLLLFAPANGGWVLFSLCAVNRFLAGLAEAAASGADEALAYDSLQGKEKQLQWDEVLATMGKRYSICMAFAMMAGAILYDANTHQWIRSALQSPNLSDSILIRIPVSLCLLQGIGAFIISLKMQEVQPPNKSKASASELFKQTWKSVTWVWKTKAAFLLIGGCMLLDATSRNFATLTSSYYRFIQLPEFTFGVIGAGISLCSFLVPYFAKPLARKFGIFTNILFASIITLTGLIGISLCKSIWGLLPAALVMVSLYHVGFITSRFLNALSPSESRATILSVKGLVFNSAYATFSLLFAQAIIWRKYGDQTENAFADALMMTPVFLILAMLLFLIFYKLRFRHSEHSS